MRIRPYAEGDLADVMELWQQCGLIMPWNDPRKDIARKLQTDPELLLVGECSGEVAASVMAGYEGHRGWINYLAVKPRFRRRGLGRMMMAEAERLLSARGCPKINLQVRTGNGAVISFYRAIGFVEDEVVSLGKRLVVD